MKCSVPKLIWRSSTRYEYWFDKTTSSDPMTSLKFFSNGKFPYLIQNGLQWFLEAQMWLFLRMSAYTKFQGSHWNVGRDLIKPILKNCLGTSNYLRNTTLCMNLFQCFDWAIQKNLNQGHIFDIKILTTNYRGVPINLTRISERKFTNKIQSLTTNYRGVPSPKTVKKKSPYNWSWRGKLLFVPKLSTV